MSRKPAAITVILILLWICARQRKELKVNRSERRNIGHDALTGLYNLEHLSEKIRHLKNDGVSRYIIYTDIPEFKLINDFYGRENGNRILTAQSDAIRKFCSEGCYFCRTNGAHFLIIADKADFNIEMLRKIKSSAESCMKGRSMRLSMHFGIYESRGLTESLEVMCDRASLAADSIKNSTEAFTAFYDDDMMQEALRKKLIIDEFDEALKNHEFKMFLQPQFEAKTGKLSGAEALVRRIRGDGSTVPPNDFISVYEKAGLVCRLDKYIWEEAAAEIARLMKNGTDINISVNISPQDFYYINVYEEFLRLVKKYDIAPGRLNAEITETALMSNVPNLAEELAMLRRAGFTVEIDDFGSGYSSLNALKDISADVLKIDMGFLSSTGNADNKRGLIILDSVIKMAKKLNMRVITEGVETKEQADELTKMECDYFQGYYFSKPVSVETFENTFLANEIRNKDTDICA